MEKISKWIKFQWQLFKNLTIVKIGYSALFAVVFLALGELWWALSWLALIPLGYLMFIFLFKQMPWAIKNFIDDLKNK